MADTRALYVISVAAELAGVHPQTLRIYERKGLLAPARTSGRSRRYSDHDIALLRRIQELTNDGVSLVGRAAHPRARGGARTAARERIAGLEARVDALQQRDRGARRGRAPAVPARARPAPQRASLVLARNDDHQQIERRYRHGTRSEQVHPQDPGGDRRRAGRRPRRRATPRSRPSTCCARCSTSPRAS